MKTTNARRRVRPPSQCDLSKRWLGPCRLMESFVRVAVYGFCTQPLFLVPHKACTLNFGCHTVSPSAQPNFCLRGTLEYVC
jgi:hypothetical protein